MCASTTEVDTALMLRIQAQYSKSKFLYRKQKRREHSKWSMYGARRALYILKIRVEALIGQLH